MKAATAVQLMLRLEAATETQSERLLRILGGKPEGSGAVALTFTTKVAREAARLAKATDSKLKAKAARRTA